MTRYYLYIKAGVQLDAGSQFFKVAIGESQKDVRVYAWVESYAYEHGHFFVRWSLPAVDFLSRCLDSVNKQILDVVPIKAKDLVSFLRDGCEEPAFYQAALSRHKLLMQIDPDYYSNYHLQNRRESYTLQECSGVCSDV
jgi:hypothetical protein